MQIDFNAAFDAVNDQGILNKPCSEGTEGSVLSILTQFLSNRLQNVMVDGFWGKLLTLCQELLREVFWARYCFSCTPRSFLYILKNKIIGCADD